MTILHRFNTVFQLPSSLGTYATHGRGPSAPMLGGLHHSAFVCGMARMADDSCLSVLSLSWHLSPFVGEASSLSGQGSCLPGLSGEPGAVMTLFCRFFFFAWLGSLLQCFPLLPRAPLLPSLLIHDTSASLLVGSYTVLSPSARFTTRRCHCGSAPAPEQQSRRPAPGGRHRLLCRELRPRPWSAVPSTRVLFGFGPVLIPAPRKAWVRDCDGTLTPPRRPTACTSKYLYISQAVRSTSRKHPVLIIVRQADRAWAWVPPTAHFWAP
ncbi:hypothetical protein F5Y18DRAFT_174085 [Xylariaceae sp. FL1019]|nr:hypothetical protein F5Y18DRAFT_174085 [Xylariaceae sp. FL1019]